MMGKDPRVGMLESTRTEGPWDKVYQDINGEAGGDRSGFSVSMSGDGNRVAIGALYNNGNVAANFTLEDIIIGELDAQTKKNVEVVDQVIRNISAIRCTANSTEEFLASPQDNTEGETIYLSHP